MIRPWFRQAAVPWKTTATQTRASGENRVSTKPGVLHTDHHRQLLSLLATRWGQLLGSALDSGHSSLAQGTLLISAKHQRGQLLAAGIGQ